MERKQFTFYESFFKAIRRIRKAADRAAAYDAICDYALYGTAPDMEKLSDAAAIAFELSRPNLDSSRRKAQGGKKGKSNAKDNGKIPERCAEDTANKKENEIEIEIEIENECYPPHPPKGGFEDFWALYPRKVGKQAALKAWSRLKPGAELTKAILEAVEYQKTSRDWARDGGRYIPNPATWLNQGRWEDELEDKPEKPRREGYV